MQRCTVRLVFRREDLDISDGLWTAERENHSSQPVTEWCLIRCRHTLLNSHHVKQGSQIKFDFVNNTIEVVFPNVPMRAARVNIKSLVGEYYDKLQAVSVVTYFAFPPGHPGRKIGCYDKGTHYANLTWENKDGGRYCLEVDADTPDDLNSLLHGITTGTITPTTDCSK